MTSPYTTYYYTRNALFFYEQHAGEAAADLQAAYIKSQRAYHREHPTPEMLQELAAVEQGLRDYQLGKRGRQTLEPVIA